mgnify:CR=1 FL=1
MKKYVYALTSCLIFMLTACTFGNKRENNGETAIMVDGYAWGTMPQKGQDDEVYCNQPVNINGLDGVIPMCYDSFYNILYYVNYGADYCIYACREGRTEKVAEVPAKRLFCREGKLYFMVESYGRNIPDGLENGNILQYDPVSGQVQTLVTKQASSMIVYQDGIYYAIEEKQEAADGIHSIVDRTLEYYKFADSSVEELKEMDGLDRTMFRCGQDFLFYVVEPYEGDDEELLRLAGGGDITMSVGMKLGDRNMQEGRVLDNLLTFRFIAAGQVIYYLDNQESQSEFAVYHTSSMEEDRFALASKEQGNFIVFDGKVYFDDLCTLDLQSGEEMTLTAEGMYGVIEWYTDGENLYGLCLVEEEGKNVVRFGSLELQGKVLYFHLLAGEENGHA